MSFAIRTVAVALVLCFVSSYALAQSATCTERQRLTVVKLLAAKDLAYANFYIAQRNLDLEKENQARLTAAFEEQKAKALDSASYYANSVKGDIVASLQKSLTKLASTRTRESASAIATKQRSFDSASSKLAKASKAALSAPCNPQ